VTTAFIDEHRNRWSVAAMCRVLELSQRSYYAAKARPASARACADEAQRIQIRRVWENNYRVYGPCRVYRQLLREGHKVARCRVERLMGDMGLHGVQRGKRRFTTTPDAGDPRPPDLVKRSFVASRPDELWLADITHCSTWQGWLDVAFILDVYSRTIVGWQIAGTCAPTWCSTHWRWRSGAATRRPAASCTTATPARSTPAFATATGWPTPGSPPRSAPSATPTTRTWLHTAPPGYGRVGTAGDRDKLG
jgi:hypothetical protein